MLDSGSAQVIPISTWDDGSVKHALIAGRAALTANVAKTVTVSRGSSSGTALREADLVGASPTASISYGSYGTLSLSSLMGTSALVLTEHAGPQYAAFQYLAAFPGDSSVRAVFYVQFWAGGSYRVRIAVENGTAPNVTSSKSGNAVVTVAGTQVFSGAVGMPNATRWDAVGANFTVPVPKHDVAYLRSTKLVPNYGWPAVASSEMAALSQTYSPMALLQWTQDQGNGGAQFGIALIPHWDAVYCCTGDAAAWRSSQAHGSAYGAYSCFYRNASTRRYAKPSDFPTAINDFDGGESRELKGNGTNSRRWEMAHVPNAGYFPWLITGERFHLETMQANAWATWLCGSFNAGNGTSRLASGETRARGWRFRNIAACAALSPDGDPVKADWTANVAAMVSSWHATHVVPNSPATGMIGIYDDKESVAGFQHTIFESLIVSESIAWSWDLEMQLPSADKTRHQALRDFGHRVIVGLTGRGPALGEFSWRRAPGPYRMTIGPSANTADLYATWSAVYAATYNDMLDSSNGQTMLESYVDDASTYAFGEGVWGYIHTALSFAVDHGATGAAAGWARVTSASNWKANTDKFIYRPQNGIKPR